MGSFRDARVIKTAGDALSRGVADLLLDQPFFAQLALRMTLVKTQNPGKSVEQGGTVSIDQRGTLRYNGSG
jgi:hypothetical protein